VPAVVPGAVLDIISRHLGVSASEVRVDSTRELKAPLNPAACGFTGHLTCRVPSTMSVFVSRNLVFFDDAAYSGTQAANTLVGLLHKTPDEGGIWTRLFVVVLFSTTTARDWFNVCFKEKQYRVTSSTPRWTVWTNGARTIHVFTSLPIRDFRKQSMNYNEQ
jgi:hypothetical protein